uniref:Uncharacterized protein n=1 Tax=Aegilops tauschii subsp. strangulata TaxID=200361 RepID=A0A453ANN3_AEGTS
MYTAKLHRRLSSISTTDSRFDPLKCLTASSSETPLRLAASSSIASSVATFAVVGSVPCSSIFCSFFTGSSAESRVPSVWDLFVAALESQAPDMMTGSPGSPFSRASLPWEQGFADSAVWAGDPSVGALPKVFSNTPRSSAAKNILIISYVIFSGSSSFIGFNLSRDPTFAMARRICEAISGVSPVSSKNLFQFISHPSRAASSMYEITVCSFIGTALRKC